MCEQYDAPSIKSWLPDKTGTAAIWIANPGTVPVEEKGLGDRYVWIKSRVVTYFSCYLTPSDSNDMFRTKLSALEDVIRVVKR